MPIDLTSGAVAEFEAPDYNVYCFTEQIYKIIWFKRKIVHRGPGCKADAQSYDFKLDASLSRTRRLIMEKALCNPWDWFCTFTLDPKFDRENIDDFKKNLPQWIRDQRKKGHDIVYLLVPELHSDGKSWHMHGLMRGVDDMLVSFADERKHGLKVSQKLIDGGYYDMPAYREKFGFCSFGRIREPVACGFYITKYVAKDVSALSARLLGQRILLCSARLNRPVLHGNVYGYCAGLHKYLTNDYEFCKTGMTHVKDGVSWDFALEYFPDAVEPLTAFQRDCIAEEDMYLHQLKSQFDAYYEGIQETLEGF